MFPRDYFQDPFFGESFGATVTAVAPTTAGSDVFQRDYFQEAFFQGEFFGAAVAAPSATDGGGGVHGLTRPFPRRREWLEEDDAEALLIILGVM